MSVLQIFNYEGYNIRTVEIDGESWWVLSDVCRVLGLSNPSVVADRLDDDERSKLDLGRQGEGIIINESGLYRVILRSDKPETKKFTRWVTHEVLPTIRKTGTYSAKGYPRKCTSAGEVASLLKPIERAMIAQKTSPNERAATIQMVCEQFGIKLPANFVKPVPPIQMMMIDYVM